MRIKRYVPEDRRESFYHEHLSEWSDRYPGVDVSAIRVGLSLLHTYEMFHQCVSRYMAEFGLSKSTLNILMLLRHGPSAGMQLHDLGEMLLVSRANITGLIDHLEEKGYVKRVVDIHDRRARYARITRKAEVLLDEFMPLHYANVRTLMEDLTTGEKEGLVTLLKKTRSSLTAHSESCAGRVRDVANG